MPEFLCAKPKSLPAQLATVPFIALHMCLHMGFCVSFIDIIICTEVTVIKYNGIVLFYMPIQIPDGFKKLATSRFHTEKTHIFMGKFMSLQPAREGERFTTSVTYKFVFTMYI